MTICGVVCTFKDKAPRNKDKALNMKSLSAFDSRLTLDFLLTEPEGQFFEKKGWHAKEVLKPAKLANELIGMLNASGGLLVLGISDKGLVDDLNGLPSATLNLYRKAVHDFIDPPATVTIEEITLPSGELIFLYHVEQNHERLYKRKDNEEVFLRVADSNHGPLKREEVKALEYNKSIRTFETELREDFEPTHLSTQTCEEYRKAMRYSGSFEDLALARGLAAKRDGRVFYNNAAILLFGENPDIHISNALVRYVRYAGTENKSGREFNVIKDERLEGNIPSLIKTLETFIAGTLRDYYFLNLTHGKFERIPEYPKEAWLEGVVNALCHRSYNLQGNSIYIKHYDDRLVISNSGPLPAQVTVENIRQQRYSRNPRIARTLYELGYVRELNEGVPRIFNAMRESMLAEPEYLNTRNTVTLTLRNKVASHRETIHADVLGRIEANWEKLNSRQKQLVNFLFETFEATLEAFTAYLHLSEQVVRYNLIFLIDLGILTKNSDKKRDRNAVYRFAEQ
jgi:ATP-dependent DNA helicase RecG